MSKGNPKALFTPNYIRLIVLARELNENEKISGDLYFHPVEAKNKIVVKTIDLTLHNPLCEANSRPSGEQGQEERWVEAYLIHEAKRNHWMLELAGKEYRFLSSQLTFRAGPIPEIKGKKHRHVDLVLYDEGEGYLVVLELKRQADKSSLCEAKNELRMYLNEIKRLIENENTAVLKAFNLKVVKGVIGYIVCPEYDAAIRELALGSYGLIVYHKGPEPWEPWQKFKDAKRAGKDFKIEFFCRKQAQMGS